MRKCSPRSTAISGTPSARHAAAKRPPTKPAAPVTRSGAPEERLTQSPSRYAKISGATIVASDWIMNFGVSTSSLPHVIFSFGIAPEYEP